MLKPLALMLTVNQVLSALDGSLQQQARQHFAQTLDASQYRPSAPLLNALSEAVHPETLERVRELSQSARHDAVQQSRYAALYRALVEAALAHTASPFVDARAHLCRSNTFTAAARTLTIDTAQYLLPRERDAQPRDAIDRELTSQLKTLESGWLRQREALERTATSLGFSTLQQARDTLAPDPEQTLLKTCRTLLKETSDAWRDLLSYGLKRIDPTLRPSTARHGDLLRALDAPWLHDFLKREDLLPAVRHWLTDWRIEARFSVETLVTHDAPRAGVFAVQVPSDIRVVWPADQGLTAARSLLRVSGTALGLSLVNAELLLVERRLADPRTARALGALSTSLLTDEAWLKRYLRQPTATAKETARLSAWATLAELRTSAASVLAAHEAVPLGASPDALECFAAHWHDALTIEKTGAWVALEHPVHLEAARQLSAWGLQEAVLQTLQQRFDEDFYRNPAAGQWVQREASKGQPTEATAASHVEGRPLDVMAAARRCVSVMGA